MTRPEQTLRQVVRQPSVSCSAAVIAVVSLVHGLDAALRWGAGEQWMAIVPADAPPGRFAVAGVAVVPLVSAVLHPLIAGLLRAVAGLLGGRGTYRGMLAGYAFALPPSTLGLLGHLPHPVGWLGTLFVLWALWLVIVAVSVNEQLSERVAGVVVGIPLLVPALVAAGVLLWV